MGSKINPGFRVDGRLIANAANVRKNVRENLDVGIVKASISEITSLSTDELYDNQIVETQGYHSAGDAGGNYYIYHTTGRPTSDSGFYIDGPGADDYFEAINKTIANVKQFGAT